MAASTLEAADWGILRHAVPIRPREGGDGYVKAGIGVALKDDDIVVGVIQIAIGDGHQEKCKMDFGCLAATKVP
jgi:hypothetical protein